MTHCPKCGRYIKHGTDGCEVTQLDLFHRQARVARIDARIRLLFDGGVLPAERCGA